MKTLTKASIITLAAGIPAFFVGPVLFPGPATQDASSIAQLTLLSLLSAAQALVLGLGVAFVALGWSRILHNAGSSGSSRARALAMCLSVTWLLVSPWLYGNLQRHFGDAAQGVPYLEYGFHVTFMVCGAVLAYALLRHGPLLTEVRRMTRIV